jgi:hypothetical protein
MPFTTLSRGALWSRLTFLLFGTVQADLRCRAWTICTLSRPYSEHRTVRIDASRLAPAPDPCPDIAPSWDWPEYRAASLHYVPGGSGAPGQTIVSLFYR